MSAVPNIEGIDLVIAVTTWPNTSARAQSERATPWSELVEWMRNPDTWADKESMPLLKLGRFGDKRSAKGALRHDENLLGISGIEAEHDAEQVSVEEAVARLERHHIRALVYTTPSHGVVNPPKSHGGPRWRVLAPLSAPASPAARAALVARINGALGGIVSAESFTASQPYYFGRVAGREYLCMATYDDPAEGLCVDELDELDNIAVGKAARTRTESAAPGAGSADPLWREAAEKVERLGRKLRTGDGRRELCKSYIASRSAKGFSAFEVRALVRAFAAEYFDPADPIDERNIDEIVGDFARKDAGKAQGDNSAAGKPADVIVQDAAEFVLAFEPPHYVVEPILARGHLVACTAHPNGGKSTLAIQITLAAAGYVRLPGLDAAPGRVLYLIGENDHNLRGQFIAACQQHGIDPAATRERIDFIPRPLALAENVATITKLAAERGGYCVIVVDTRISYSGSTDENDNAQAYDDAAALRELTRAEGSPAVLVLCHPPKGAPRDNLIPRGGSSFYGEIDENLTLWADGEDVTLDADKRRIPDFAPIEWRIEAVALAGYTDHKGRPIRSVIGYRVTEQQQEAAAGKRREDENRLLYALLHHPSESYSGLASQCGWTDPAGKPQRWKVQRVAERLAEHKLARRYRERWILTAAGKDEAAKI